MIRSIIRFALAGFLSATVMAQSAAPRKKLLVIGEEKGYRHEAVTHAMATIAATRPREQHYGTRSSGPTPKR